ncbi:MAG: RNA pseudouridine synthase [Bacteroidetes bacterium HGW-Bacteroidetes-4]|jgi:23S rRNA pseudouridine1911/1915/1917 synthase|nr:MAG: RNA pseudouridine synthase [Bacteroidetes bacterium HGW-Bacteroidetes-4]
MDAAKVLFEDNHIIAINKSVSDIVQGDKTGDEPLSEQVKSYLKAKYQKPGNVFVGVTHRLDRPTSGVVLFARTSKALARLNAMFQEKTQIKKTYWAIVKNRPEADTGRLVHFLLRDTQKNKSTVVKKPVKEAKEAILEYELIAQSDNFYLLQINLLTGRHHQIRAQLAAIGSPIKGDLKYGFPRSNPDGGISLHARSIEFVHPVSKENVKIIAPVPDDILWKYFEDASQSK